MVLQTKRQGFALPMAILLIGFLTAGVLAGFARAGAEIQIADNQSAETAAFALAEAGLSDYMGRGKVSPASVTYSYPEGQADVTATLMQNGATATDPDIYLIRSVGRPSGAPNRPQATREVAQLAVRTVATMQVLSSWTSLSGVHKNGASGSISGFDACTGAAVAGVATPDGMLTGTETPITGTPDHDEMGTVEEMAAQIQIDWRNIAKPVAPAIQPENTVCVSGTYGYDAAYSCNGWPTTTTFASGWPTVLINGSSALPSNGRGVLIVTGDLTLGGGDRWEGVILVGGRIIDNGNGDIDGAVVTGLNVLKECPEGSGVACTVGQSSRANGTKAYQYNSCAVASATDGLSRLNQITNAWADNLSTW